MRRFAHSLYAQVLVAVALGAILGIVNPALGAAMKPLGDGFIKLVKMLIAPIVFATVVTGIAKMGDLKRVGRIGLKGIVYFEVLTTFALAHVLFRIVAIVMRIAPLGAFGAMAFTVGKYGIKSLLSLGELMATFYVTSLLFVLLVLGLVMRWAGLGILRFLRYIREEILIVLGTSSSESALPLPMRKLERLGCPESVVGLLVPMGYSFNLDGTSIYLRLATLFIAQATNTHVTLGQELEILAVLLLTSKGAAAVTGGGFITLAATLSAVGNIPVAGLALLLGIDRFMSEARAITNLIGNGVAPVAVSRWEGELDAERARRILAGVAEV